MFRSFTIVLAVQSSSSSAKIPKIFLTRFKGESSSNYGRSGLNSSYSA